MSCQNVPIGAAMAKAAMLKTVATMAVNFILMLVGSNGMKRVSRALKVVW
jgi:hypothetical protein